MADAYPLDWPLGYPRAKRRQESLFATSFRAARDGLLDELRLMRARDVVISTNIPLRLDGLPYARYRAPEDPGVAVYFTLQKEPYVLACDKWRKVEDNLQAIRKTVEALRGLDRWGVSEMLKRAFSGFKALPANGTGTAWWRVLGVAPDASHEEIRKAYRRRAMETHPDQGGSEEAFRAVQDALNQGLSVHQ